MEQLAEEWHMDFNILYRTSGKTNQQHRMGHELKTEWAGKCLDSLAHSISNSYHVKNLLDTKLIVVNDNSCAEWETEAKRILHKNELTSSWVPCRGTGNGPSLRHVVDLAASLKDIVFLVEDDWLFKPEAIEQMLKTYFMFKEKDIETVIHPADYPDRYYREMYPSYIYIGDDRHWRTIRHTTCTIMLNSSVVRDHYEHFKGLENFGVVLNWGEDQCLNKVYEYVMCLSPMPSLATHYQHPAYMSPFWDKS